MKFDKRISVSDNLDKYCVLSKKDDFIEVTRWSNEDGFDIVIGGEDNKNISLTIGEIDAISYLTKTLEYREEDEEWDQ